MTKIRIFVRSLILVVLIAAALPLVAQEGELKSEQPKGTTVDEIIRKFAAKEAEFKKARERYTWRQDVKVQTIDDGGRVDGEYRNVVDILFDDKGKRVEHVVFAPQNTLVRIEMSREDLDDIEKRMPFTVTSDDLPQYHIKYVGQQQEDELNTYVFDLSPKKIEKGQRYFDGRIWVDDRDFQIVKTYGKNVPDIVQPKKGQENLFPRFTTWREQIDGKYWFPTYTKVDDTLHFQTNDVRIRQVIKYTDYKQFGSSSRITFEGQEVQKDPSAPSPQK